MTVAVAFWMGGFTMLHTEFEKIEIQSARCMYNSSGSYWKLMLKINNTGTVAAVLDTAFINDVEVKNYGKDAVVTSQTSTNMTRTTITLNSGCTRIISLYIDLGASASGTTVNVKIRSGAGMDYIKRVVLG